MYEYLPKRCAVDVDTYAPPVGYGTQDFGWYEWTVRHAEQMQLDVAGEEIDWSKSGNVSHKKAKVTVESVVNASVETSVSTPTTVARSVVVMREEDVVAKELAHSLAAGKQIVTNVASDGMTTYESDDAAFSLSMMLVDEVREKESLRKRVVDLHEELHVLSAEKERAIEELTEQAVAKKVEREMLAKLGAAATDKKQLTQKVHTLEGEVVSLRVQVGELEVQLQVCCTMRLFPVPFSDMMADTCLTLVLGRRHATLTRQLFVWFIVGIVISSLVASLLPRCRCLSCSMVTIWLSQRLLRSLVQRHPLRKRVAAGPFQWV